MGLERETIRERESEARDDHGRGRSVSSSQEILEKTKATLHHEVHYTIGLMTCGKEGVARGKRAPTISMRKREGVYVCRKLYSEVNSWVGESNAFGMRCLCIKGFVHWHFVWTVGLTGTAIVFKY